MDNFLYFDYEADSDNTFHLLGQRYLEKTSQWSLNRALDSAAKCSNIRIGEPKDDLFPSRKSAQPKITVILS